MNKYHVIAERAWLVISVVTALIAVYEIGKNGLEQSMTYLAFPFIAFALFYMRHYARKRLERQAGQDKEPENDRDQN